MRTMLRRLRYPGAAALEYTLILIAMGMTTMFLVRGFSWMLPYYYYVGILPIITQGVP